MKQTSQPSAPSFQLENYCLCFQPHWKLKAFISISTHGKMHISLFVLFQESSLNHVCLNDQGSEDWQYDFAALLQQHPGHEVGYLWIDIDHKMCKKTGNPRNGRVIPFCWRHYCTQRFHAIVLCKAYKMKSFMNFILSLEWTSQMKSYIIKEQFFSEKRF